MDKEQFRSEFSQAFYRSVEEGGIEISALPAAQLQALSKACADAVFATLDHLDRPKPDLAEEVLWSGKPFMRLGEYYELTSQRLRIYKGIFSRSMHEVDLVYVREATFTQNIGERMWNLGDVKLITTNSEHATVILENVKEPEKVREIIRDAYLAEQKRRGLRYRDGN